MPTKIARSQPSPSAQFKLKFSPSNPLIIAVTNLKGGVAKTTTAVHFAEYLRQYGETVLIDSDPNRSAIAWAGRNASDPNFHVISDVQMPRYGGRPCYVVDTQARPNTDDLRELISTATVIVLPTPPSGDDLRVTAQTAELLSSVGSKIHRVLLTKVPVQPGSTRVLEAQKYLQDSGIPVFKTWIRQYMAYQDAFIEGLPVSQFKNPKSADAWADYQAVMEEILNG